MTPYFCDEPMLIMCTVNSTMVIVMTVISLLTLVIAVSFGHWHERVGITPFPQEFDGGLRQ